MSLVSTEVRCKIERIVRRWNQQVEADFNLLTPEGPWLCCSAWIKPEDAFQPGARIQARGNAMTIEQAEIVQVAIRMAIDWVLSDPVCVSPTIGL
jgi:hypothetical protein